MRALRSCARIVLLVLGVLVTETAQAAEQVAVRAAAHPTYGRLVLDWAAPVAVRRDEDERRLVLRFDRPFEADLAPAERPLEAYVEDLAQSPDRLELRVLLRPGIGVLRLAQYDPDLVVLDLAAGGGGSASPAPADVAVRTGRHEGYTRIVFDFDGPVGFSVERNSVKVDIVFDRPAAFDAVALGRELRPLVDELSAHTGGAGGVGLRLRPGVAIDVFKLDHDKVVVELRQALEGNSPRLGAVAVEARADHEVATSPPVLESVEADAGEAAAAREMPEPVRANGAPPEAGRTRAATGSAELVGPIALIAPAAEPPEGSARVGGSPHVEAVAVEAARTTRGIQLSFMWPEPVPAAVFTRAGWLWIAFASGSNIEPESRLAADPEVDGVIGAPEAVPAGPGATVLRYPIRQLHGAEAHRVGSIWHVVLRPHPEPPRAVTLTRSPDRPRLQIQARGARQVLNLVDPAVGDRLQAWPLLQSPLGVPEARRMVEVELLPTAQGVVIGSRSDALIVDVDDDGLELHAAGGLHLSGPDPGVVEEGRVVVPRQASRGQGPASAPESPGSMPAESDMGVAALPPAPPDAWRQREDDPRPLAGQQRRTAAGETAPADETADLPAGPAPVALELPAAPDEPLPEAAVRADGTARDQAAGPPSATDAGAAPLGLAHWALAPGETMPARRSALMRRVEEAEAAAGEQAQLDLARFFLAQAMAAETLAVLDSRHQDGPVDGEPLRLARQSLSGAAELLMGRLHAAGQALEVPALDQDPEIALWRAAVAAARNDWQQAAEELGRAESTLESYPPALQLRLGLPAALIAVETGRPGLAFSILDRLSALDLLDHDRARLRFIRGLAYARNGAAAEAAKLWRQLKDTRDEETRVKADFALTTMLLDEGEITNEEALARLGPARPLWRGHPWEFTMLNGLAEVQVRTGDAAGAIRTWQDASQRDPAAAVREDVDARVRTTFVDALDLESAHPLAPVRALSLHHDHPELMPTGEEGRRLRRKLASQLAELDLIEPAATLLSELVEGARPGPATARDGAALAEIWLRERRGEAALAALETTGDGEVPTELRRRRQILEVRALALLDRSEAALVLLGDRDDPEAQALRTEILWRGRNWPRLVRVIEATLASVELDQGRLPPDAQTLVVKLAIAYAQLQQRDGLAAVKERFGPAMRGTAAEPAFLMATAAGAAAAEPEAVLAAAERQIQEVRNYLMRR